MTSRDVTLIALTVLAVAQLSYRPAAQGDEVKAAYDRAESFNRRTEGLVTGVAEAPNFLEAPGKLWYRKSVMNTTSRGVTTSSALDPEKPVR